MTCSVQDFASIDSLTDSSGWRSLNQKEILVAALNA